MYLPLKIHYWHDSWTPYKDDAKYAELREAIQGLPEKREIYGEPKFWGTIANMRTLDELGLEWGLDKEELASSTGTMVTKMQDRIESTFGKSESAQLEHAVQIAIPDLGLLVIDEVEILDDACTDQLQESLDNGWRILAVCPPNAQRRPDFILGRRKANR